MMKKNKIVILGLGSIGSNLAYHLVSDVDHMIYLIDYDKVENRNIQAKTQFYKPEQKGQSKVESLEVNLYEWTDKARNIVSMEGKIKDSIPLKTIDDAIFVDCFDNHTSRELIRSTCEPCLHIGFSPKMTYSIIWNDKYKTPEDIMGDFDICASPGAASFVRMVTAHASLIIQRYLNDGDKISVVGNKFGQTQLR